MEPLLEVCLTTLYMIPVPFFRYAAFTPKFRFSIKKTILLFFTAFFLLNLVAYVTGIYQTFSCSNIYRSFLYTMMILFSFFLIKDNIGKQFFVISLYGTLSYLLTALSLLIELTIYPATPADHLVYKVISLSLLQLIFLPIIYFFVHRPLASILLQSEHQIWRVLWIVSFIQLLLPAFITLPVFGISIRKINIAAVRFILSFCSFFVDAIIIRLIKNVMDANTKAQELESAKQQLIIQQYQYRTIQEEMENSRRFRHDFKHHTAMILGILNDSSLQESQKLQQLFSYCTQYFDTLPCAEETLYCSNYPLNLLLNYYSAKAKEQNITVTIHVALTNTLTIEDTDLCVLIGNLFTNALEAAVYAPSSLRFIAVDIIKHNHNLLISLDNGFDGHLKKLSDVYLSTKHEKRGIGLTSVKNIANHYHGICRFEPQSENNMVFTSRVHLVLPD